MNLREIFFSLAIAFEQIQKKIFLSDISQCEKLVKRLSVGSTYTVVIFWNFSESGKMKFGNLNLLNTTRFLQAISIVNIIAYSPIELI